MSNLLKKDMESGIATFGFPAIERDSGESTVFAKPEERPREPEINSEEIYRRKLLEVERRTQEIERDAYSQGFAQGKRNGIEYGQKSVQVARSQLERIVHSMEALPGKILQDYRDWLIRTSTRIARQIVNREIQTSPEIVAGTVKSLLEEADEHGTLAVYLHPKDMEIVAKRGGIIGGTSSKQLALKADKGLERGDCRIESAIQQFDASIAVLFENVEKKMMDEERSAEEK